MVLEAEVESFLLVSFLGEHYLAHWLTFLHHRWWSSSEYLESCWPLIFVIKLWAKWRQIIDHIESTGRRHFSFHSIATLKRQPYLPIRWKHIPGRLFSCLWKSSNMNRNSCHLIHSSSGFISVNKGKHQPLLRQDHIPLPFPDSSLVWWVQIRRSLLNEDEYGFRRAKRPIYYDEGLEVIILSILGFIQSVFFICMKIFLFFLLLEQKTRQTLNAKINQLNSAIDNVSSRLRGGGNGASEPVEADSEVEASLWALHVPFKFFLAWTCF